MGKLDLIAGMSYSGVHGNGTIGVLLGNGNGTFQPMTFYGAGLIPLSLTFADFNGDGFPDVATANLVSNSVTVLLNAQGKRLRKR